MLEEHGYEVLSFNTVDFSKSLHYNPIAYVRDEADILEFVTCLIANAKGDEEHCGDPFWENAERLLYVALVGYLVKHCPRHNRSLSGLVTLLSLAGAREDDEDYMSPLDLLFHEVETGKRYVSPKKASEDSFDCARRGSYDPSGGTGRWVQYTEPVAVEDDFCLLHYKMFKDAAGKTLKSILVSCNTRMEPFAIPQVRELVSFDEMHLDKLGDAEGRRAVFAIMSDTSSLYSFLFAIMMWQATNMLCKRALTEYGGSLPVPVQLMYDEFANIGKLSDVEKAVAVIRSRNISMSIGLQSLSQLKSRYGDAVAVIVDCCDTTLFLGGKSTETVKEISEAIGKQTVDTVTWNESRGSSASSTRNWNTLERDLIQAAEVAKLSRDEAILLIAGADPLKDRKYDVTMHRAFRREVGALCLHFWDRPKPLPALWRMPKALDRLSADCINPCLNIFLRSTEHGFIELHIEARLHDCAFAGFLKVLQRVSQPAAIGGKRIHDLPGQVSPLQETAHGGRKGVPPDRRTQDDGVVISPTNVQRLQFRAITLGNLTLPLIDDFIIIAIVGNNRIHTSNIPADFPLDHLGDALRVASVGVVQNQGFHFTLSPHARGFPLNTGNALNSP